MRYVIGDVHGCSETLKALLERLQLQADDQVYLVGDLIDRGPGSRQVIETLWLLQHQISLVKSCRGNHEQLLLDAMNSDSVRDLWLMNGGEQTLESYGVKKAGELPADHLDWLGSLSYYIETPEALIVHAGFNFLSKDIFADPFSMMWTREHNCNPDLTGGRYIIHGHTPVTIDKCDEQITEGKMDINIDTGCVYDDRPGFGYLTAFCIESRKLLRVKNLDIIS